MPRPVNLSPAQIALQAERKAAKLAKKAAAAQHPNPQQALEAEKRRFLKRDWTGVQGDESSRASVGLDRGRRVKIVTWNLLAQTLVRRELFPGSDCLRWTERKPMMMAELEHYSLADIVCLQECDRLDDITSSLPSHSDVSGRGPGKLHGVVVLFRTARFARKASKVVMLDEEELSPEAPRDGGASETGSDERRRRRGGTRQTKNVGLIVVLEDKEHGGGLVVATTHLFWHPKFIYERVRQIIVLLRAIRDFQKTNGSEGWPVVFAGDLNTSPSEAPYQLLADPSRPLSPSALADLEDSRLVHTTVDKVVQTPAPPVDAVAASATPSESGTGANTPTPFKHHGEKDEEDELPDSSDKSIANTRTPRLEDGILASDELVERLREVVPEGAMSAYGTGGWAGQGGETFGSRGGFAGIEDARQGSNEPGYTCFTPLFQLTLDYLFLLAGEDRPAPRVLAVLRPATKGELGEGLPRKGISASDHLAVGCEITW